MNMEKYSTVYFGEKGLTSKSANFLANIAQEHLSELTAKVTNMKLYNKTASFLDSEVVKNVVVGVNENEFDKIISDFTEKASAMNAFTAWVREAIKRKQLLVYEVENKDIEAWYKETHGEDFPKLDYEILNEDIMEEFDVKERARYLAVEAMASVYGQLVHRGGTLNVQRNEMYNAIASPTRLTEMGRDSICYEQKPSLSSSHVEETYNELQKKYRSYEAELNKMKADIENTSKMRRLENTMKKNIATQQFDAKLSERHTEFFEWKQQELKKIQGLKIVIPNSMLETFKFLQSLGGTSKS